MERCGRERRGQPPFREEEKCSKEALTMSSSPRAQKTQARKEPEIDQYPHLALGT